MAIEITGDAERELADRILRALEIAPIGRYDGAHHKDWVLDQMVRALTGCPVAQARPVPLLGESEEYLRFRRANPGWPEGIAP